jgi:YceI-like protein
MNMKVSLKAGVAAAIGLVALIGVAGVVARINYGRPPALGLPTPAASPSPIASPSPDDPLAAACRAPAPPSNSTELSGLWVIQPSSIVGYRAHEKFASLPAPGEAVARTERVAGWLLVSGQGSSYKVDSGCIAVDVRTLRSIDEVPGFNTADRDENVRGFLRTDSNPFAIFKPYSSTVDADPASTAAVTVSVTGDFEVAGITKPAKFSLTIKRQAERLGAAGKATIDTDQYAIELPRTPADFVVVDPHIVLEVALVLGKA